MKQELVVSAYENTIAAFQFLESLPDVFIISCQEKFGFWYEGSGCVEEH